MQRSCLTPHQRRIVQLVAAGFKNQEIGHEIGTTELVIKNYLRVIYRKLSLANRLEVTLWYLAQQYEGTLPPVVEKWSRPLMVPLRGVSEQIDMKLIHDHLDSTLPRNREIFLLYYQHGQSHHQIGHQFGIPAARAQQITTAVLSKIHDKVLA